MKDIETLRHMNRKKEIRKQQEYETKRRQIDDDIVKRRTQEADSLTAKLIKSVKKSSEKQSESVALITNCQTTTMKTLEVINDRQVASIEKMEEQRVASSEAIEARRVASSEAMEKTRAEKEEKHLKILEKFSTDLMKANETTAELTRLVMQQSAELRTSHDHVRDVNAILGYVESSGGLRVNNEYLDDSEVGSSPFAGGGSGRRRLALGLGGRKHRDRGASKSPQRQPQKRLRVERCFKCDKGDHLTEDCKAVPCGYCDHYYCEHRCDKRGCANVEDHHVKNCKSNAQKCSACRFAGSDSTCDKEVCDRGRCFEAKSAPHHLCDCPHNCQASTD